MLRLPGTDGRARRPVEQGGGRALLLAASGLLLSASLFPWGLVGLAVEVAAVVIALRTLRRARRRGAVAPFAKGALVAASIAVFLFVVALTFVGVFHKEYGRYEDCMSRAITGSAADECRSDFEHAVRVRLGLST